jgi:hypothetical protein
MLCETIPAHPECDDKRLNTIHTIELLLLLSSSRHLIHHPYTKQNAEHTQIPTRHFPELISSSFLYMFHSGTMELNPYCLHIISSLYPGNKLTKHEIKFHLKTYYITKNLQHSPTFHASYIGNSFMWVKHLRAPNLVHPLVAELIALCTLNKTWNLKGQALLLHYP